MPICTRVTCGIYQTTNTVQQCTQFGQAVGLVLLCVQVRSGLYDRPPTHHCVLLEDAVISPPFSLPRSPPPSHPPQYPTEIIKKAWSLGLVNISIPAAYGGAGLSVMDEVIIGEELSYGCTGISTALAANSLAVRSSPVAHLLSCVLGLILVLTAMCVGGGGGRPANCSLLLLNCNSIGDACDPLRE